MLKTINNKKSQVAYSVKSAAIQLDVSVQFLRKEIRNGNLKAKKVGSRVLILESSLLAYLEGKDDWKPAASNNGSNN